MYKNNENKIDLIFVHDLKDITNINKLYHSNEIESLKLFKNLNHLLHLILQKIVMVNQLESKTSRFN